MSRRVGEANISSSAFNWSRSTFRNSRAFVEDESVIASVARNLKFRTRYFGASSGTQIGRSTNANDRGNKLKQNMRKEVGKNNGLTLPTILKRLLKDNLTLHAWDE